MEWCYEGVRDVQPQVCLVVALRTGGQEFGKSNAI